MKVGSRVRMKVRARVKAGVKGIGFIFFSKYSERPGSEASRLTGHIRSSFAMEVPSDSVENAIATGIVPPSVARCLCWFR